jgi:hypothetical protein
MSNHDTVPAHRCSSKGMSDLRISCYTVCDELRIEAFGSSIHAVVEN